jgi:glycosyltransferase involved in cell wall biosynthesis
MKILMVLEYYPPHIGGVETLFENLAEKLAEMGHSVEVVTCQLPESPHYEKKGGVHIYRVRVPGIGRRYWFTFLALPQVWKLAKTCDVIHTTTYNGAFPALVVSKLRRKKSLITVHEIFCAMWKNLPLMSYANATLHRLLERLVIALPFDKYVCDSRYTRNALRLSGIKDEKIKTIYPGLDYELFNPQKASPAKVRKRLGLKDEFLYLFHGRPGCSKGVEFLIRAVPIISQRIPNSRLLLILSPEPNQRYKNILKMIKDLGVEKEIFLLEPVKRGSLPDYIMSADCVVVPSLSEGFGFMAAEACAMGKPVVASDVGSLPEVVSGRYVLTPPRSPQAIADGVYSVYKDEVPERDKKTFDWNETVLEYVNLYQEIGSGGYF